jgi:hypothetical protein
MVFADHFSARASDYAEHRPVYPAELSTFLASLTARHELVWDCGTGSGQAAVVVAANFDRVVATDPSAASSTDKHWSGIPVCRRCPAIW